MSALAVLPPANNWLRTALNCTHTSGSLQGCLTVWPHHHARFHPDNCPAFASFAAATGVAVAAYQKLAPQMRSKHSVVVAVGGNMTAEGMERVVRVAGRAAAAGAPA